MISPQKIESAIKSTHDLGTGCEERVYDFMKKKITIKPIDSLEKLNILI